MIKGQMRETMATKRDKTRILDEFMTISGFHRKHGVRFLNGLDGQYLAKQAYSRRICDEAVLEALIFTWEASDRICGKRLKAVLPDMVEAMGRHIIWN